MFSSSIRKIYAQMKLENRRFARSAFGHLTPEWAPFWERYITECAFGSRGWNSLQIGAILNIRRCFYIHSVTFFPSVTYKRVPSTALCRQSRGISPPLKPLISFSFFIQRQLPPWWLLKLSDPTTSCLLQFHLTLLTADKNRWWRQSLLNFSLYQDEIRSQKIRDEKLR